MYLVAWNGGNRDWGTGDSDGGLLELVGGKPCRRNREERTGKEVPQPLGL